MHFKNIGLALGLIMLNLEQKIVYLSDFSNCWLDGWPSCRLLGQTAVWLVKLVFGLSSLCLVGQIGVWLVKMLFGWSNCCFV